MSITSNIANVASALTTGSLVNNLNADLLDGKSGSYYSDISNTSIDIASSAFNKANSSFDTANSAVDISSSAFIQANASFEVANTANSNIALLQGVNESQNASITFTQGVDDSQNASISASFIQANASFGVANSASQNLSSNVSLQEGINSTQNNSISSAFIQANASFEVANTANADIIVIRGVDDSQNTSISSAFVQANSAFDVANTKFNSSGGTVTGDVIITGNVGINNNSPSYRIDVVGNQRLYVADSSGNAYTNYSNPDKNWYLGIRGDTSDTFCLSDDTAIRLLVTTSGNVGIGTSTPPSTLSIRRASGSILALQSETANTNALGGYLTFQNAVSSASNGNGVARIGFGTGSTIGAGYLSFETSSGNSVPTERLRVDSSGNVGIGTTTPIQKLHVGGTGNIYVSAGGTFYSGGHLYIRAGSSGNLRLGANDTNDLATLDSSGNFYINSTYALGKLTVGVGNTNPDGQTTNAARDIIAFANSTAGVFGIWPLRDGGSPYDGGLAFLGQYYDGSSYVWKERMRISSSGNVTIGGTVTVASLTETSSETLKENIHPLENALESVLLLNSKIYDRKDGSSKNEVGLIAEEVNCIIPNIVSKDENGSPVGIHYTKLTAYLIESIKSLRKEIEELKNGNS